MQHTTRGRTSYWLGGTKGFGSSIAEGGRSTTDAKFGRILVSLLDLPLLSKEGHNGKKTAHVSLTADFKRYIGQPSRVLLRPLLTYRTLHLRYQPPGRQQKKQHSQQQRQTTSNATN